MLSSSFRFLLLFHISACFADSAQLHAVVAHLEAEVRGIWDRQSIEIVVFEIEELVAAETHQVVVEFEARVEAGDATGMAGLCDHAHAGEVLEGAINGGACDPGEAVFNGIEDLIGRGVIVELEDGFEDHAALHRTALAALATELFEKLDAICPCRLVQAAAPRNSATMTRGLDANMWHQE